MTIKIVRNIVTIEKIKFILLLVQLYMRLKIFDFVIKILPVKNKESLLFRLLEIPDP